jgi:hypothetical protein
MGSKRFFEDLFGPLLGVGDLLDEPDKLSTENARLRVEVARLRLLEAAAWHWHMADRDNEDAQWRASMDLSRAVTSNEIAKQKERT